MSENNPYNTEFYNKEEKPKASAQDTGSVQPPFRQRNSQGHIWMGLMMVLIGLVYLLKKMGFVFPEFVFTWQMFLIVLGIFIGFRKNFQGPGWLILILVGSLFLVNEYFLFNALRQYILPIALIGAGLFFILRPKKSYEFITKDPETGAPNGKKLYTGNVSNEDFIDTTSIFGGTKKKVLSKNFKGGDMVNIFGGSEIDLLQADINGTAVLDITAMFGGATLLIPSHWNVISSDATAILGEIKDRRVSMGNIDPSKNLILKGTVILGGIDIKSF
ncbi:hypothetical protein A8C56_17455 [Niabella ginsenosidivorans]|uniref:LiaF transmembrane domain-containing protein n=1 Tax=Niabella ginsenosidivorans TaxID=1176587 RepID=A0A1A9I749_9BACT|nr:DUF5668 domain-containing protein [Niabella ginsenosidivorans]ANH82521.1 hypothetical protein A8C56_17455 [Niabella ginsenosidivorans]